MRDAPCNAGKRSSARRKRDEGEASAGRGDAFDVDAAEVSIRPPPSTPPPSRVGARTTLNVGEKREREGFVWPFVRFGAP